MFKLNDEVIVKEEFYATVIGFFSEQMIIVLFDEPQKDGSFGRVVHQSELRLTNEPIE